MRFIRAYLMTAAVQLAHAQLPNLPGCALGCLVTALANDGCAGLTNFTCHCAVPGLVRKIVPCVQSACPISDQISVSNQVTSICSSAGVPITIPPVTVTGTGSTTIISITSTGPTSTTRSSSSASSFVSSTSRATTMSPSSPIASSVVSPTGSASVVTTAASTSIASGTATTTAAGGVPHSTGAAVPGYIPFVGTGVLVIGAAVMFALY